MSTSDDRGGGDGGDPPGTPVVGSANAPNPELEGTEGDEGISLTVQVDGSVEAADQRQSESNESIRYVTDLVDARQKVNLSDPKWDSVRPKFGKLISFAGAEPTVIVGGKPNSSYDGLDPEDHVDVTPLRSRSYLPIKNQKSSNERSTGLSTKFTRKGDLRNLAIDVKDHLRKHGIDTSAWLPDPSGEELINVSMRCSLTTSMRLVATLLAI